MAHEYCIEVAALPEHQLEVATGILSALTSHGLESVELTLTDRRPRPSNLRTGHMLARREFAEVDVPRTLGLLAEHDLGSQQLAHLVGSLKLRSGTSLSLSMHMGGKADLSLHLEGNLARTSLLAPGGSSPALVHAMAERLVHDDVHELMTAVCATRSKVRNVTWHGWPSPVAVYRRHSECLLHDVVMRWLAYETDTDMAATRGLGVHELGTLVTQAAAPREARPWHTSTGLTRADILNVLTIDPHMFAQAFATVALPDAMECERDAEARAALRDVTQGHASRECELLEKDREQLGPLIGMADFRALDGVNVDQGWIASAPRHGSLWPVYVQALGLVSA